MFEKIFINSLGVGSLLFPLSHKVLLTKKQALFLSWLVLKVKQSDSALQIAQIARFLSVYLFCMACNFVCSIIIAKELPAQLIGALNVYDIAYFV